MGVQRVGVLLLLALHPLVDVAVAPSVNPERRIALVLVVLAEPCLDVDEDVFLPVVEGPLRVPLEGDILTRGGQMDMESAGCGGQKARND